VARNTNSVDRIGYLSAAGKTVTIRQDGAPADTNGDGLPDSWQELFFGIGNANSPNAASGFDYDIDGMTNLQEYLSGTNPTDHNSVLRIISFNLASADLSFGLAFPSVIQRYYQVQRTPTLTPPNWQGFTNAVIGTGTSLPQSGPLVTSDPQMFYRVLLVE